MTIVALIVAAGRGVRAGGDLPKQYRLLGGKSVLRRSVEAFMRHPGVDSVLVAIHPDDRALYDRAMAGLSAPAPVLGGDTRQESVRRGLEVLAAAVPDPPEAVLIHDAARPFVSQAVISRVLDALRTEAGAVPALPLVDSVKKARDGALGAAVDRIDLLRVQTPQGFRLPAILAAHRAAQGAGLSDDAAVAEKAGLRIAWVAGSEDNYKITGAEDFERARRHISNGLRDMRIGQGYDVHRFGPGDAVTLCGVRIPHEQSLEGHSDADVGLHALTDALLGAAAEGDIGQHFPPSDPRWKGADSTLFLKHARDLIVTKEGRIRHVDVTLICEKPRVAPHRKAMVERIAELLEMEKNSVSVKATTTEGLGFTGRKEGIAAMAVATVLLPSSDEGE